MIASHLRSLLFALALLGAAVGLRAPFLHRAIWNLDEGSTFTMAEQVLHGDVLYRNAADNRSPLIPYLKAALFAVFGEWNAFAVHVVLALLLGACAIVLWRLARRLGDEPAGIAAALIFTLLSFVMLDGPDAISANTGWFLVVFSTLGYGAFVLALTKKSLPLGTLSGLSFGLSFLCKQPGLLDFGATWVVLALHSLATADSASRRAHLRLFVVLLVGFAVPVIAFVAYFAAHHALADARYYAFTYNSTIYIPEIPRLERLSMMRRPFELALQHAPAVFVLALGAAGALLLHVFRALRSAPLRTPLLPWLILGWSAAGIVSTGLSGRGFSHYSAQVVPGFSLAAGWAISRLIALRRPANRRIFRLFASAVVVLTALSLCYDYSRSARALSPDDDFPKEIGALIASHSAPSDRVFVWGYFPEFYYFARRLPATRFVYTVFVTGMIPWTNLDPLKDTSYASVPGSRDDLLADLERHPPTVILDAGASRGYLKYPLHDESALWRFVRAGFAQTEVGFTAKWGMRLFQKLQPAAPYTLPGDTPTSPAVALTGFSSLDRHEPPRLQVRAPAGASAIELYAGDQRIAALACPTDRPVDVLFFALPAAPGVLFRAAVVSPAGRQTSAPFDFNTFAARAAHPVIDGPALHVGPTTIRPNVIRREGAPSPSPSLPDVWRVDPPSEIAYDCPADLVAVSFIHGQEAAAQGKSDGYDLLVTFLTEDGRSYELHRQRLHPRTIGADQQPQSVRLILPPHLAGRLVFRFLAGENNSPDYDWIFFGQLKAETRGPALTLGDRFILPALGTGPDQSALRPLSPRRWATHAPTQLEWPRPAALAALDLTFGIDDGSYTAANGHSDGVIVSLDLVGDDGQSRRLFEKALWPFNHPEHRGPQHARVEIPPHVPGRLIYRVDPGPNHDLSWDWAWLDDPHGEGYGPAIEIDAAHRIVADSALAHDDQPAKRNGPDRWDGHADSELTFPRPANLRRVSFTYGLADGAARDEHGQQRSDGIVVTAVFTPEQGAPVELLRRTLDPFAEADDAGPQTATLKLPPWQPGRLTFRIDRGPAHNASYDWAYWGPFTGLLEDE